MGKKVKCKDCSNMMEWAMPLRVTAVNYEAAKSILMIAKKICACGETTKTWFIEQEHDCSRFRRRDGVGMKRYEGHHKRIEHLENMIKEYEATSNKV